MKVRPEGLIPLIEKLINDVAALEEKKAKLIKQLEGLS